MFDHVEQDTLADVVPGLWIMLTVTGIRPFCGKCGSMANLTFRALYALYWMCVSLTFAIYFFGVSGSKVFENLSAADRERDYLPYLAFGAGQLYCCLAMPRFHWIVATIYIDSEGVLKPHLLDATQIMRRDINRKETIWRQSLRLVIIYNIVFCLVIAYLYASWIFPLVAEKKDAGSTFLSSPLATPFVIFHGFMSLSLCNTILLFCVAIKILAAGHKEQLITFLDKITMLVGHGSDLTLPEIRDKVCESIHHEELRMESLLEESQRKVVRGVYVLSTGESQEEETLLPLAAAAAAAADAALHQLLSLNLRAHPSLHRYLDHHRVLRSRSQQQ
jgi:hypothetical protein